MLESLFYKVVGLQLYQKQTPAQTFSSEYRVIFRAPILKNICEWLLLCTFLVSCTIIFQIHTELLLYVQLSLLSAQNLLIIKLKEVCKLRLMKTYDPQIDRNVRKKFYINVKTKSFSCFNWNNKAFLLISNF